MESMAIVSFKVVGIKPLIQSNATVMLDPEKGVGKNDSAHDLASKQLYVADDGRFYHPAEAWWKQLMQDTTGRTIGKAAATSICARHLCIAEEEFFLCTPESISNGGKPKYLTDADWVVDTRPVVNKKMGRTLAHRPKWREWAGVLNLEVELEPFAGKTMEERTETAHRVLSGLLNLMGRMGVGCGRTRKDGTKWVSIGMGKYKVI